MDSTNGFDDSRHNLGCLDQEFNSIVGKGIIEINLDDFDKSFDRDGKHINHWMYDKVPYFPLPLIKNTLPIMPNFPIRDDDVFMCSYPSSGSHWFWEMIFMLLRGKAEHLTGTKEQDMMEIVMPDFHEKRQSPRVLNSHLRPRHLPEKMVKEGKIILLIRNPKDVVVSNYRLASDMRPLGYEGSFPSFFEMFMEGKTHCGSWFDYTNEWIEATEQNPNILIVTYEEAKKDTPVVLSRLSRYLNLEQNNDLVKNIAELCSFKSMKAAKTNNIAGVDLWKQGGCMYRSGKTGTWKDWLSVEQNERMDKYLKTKLKNLEISKMLLTI